MTHTTRVRNLGFTLNSCVFLPSPVLPLSNRSDFQGFSRAFLSFPAFHPLPLITSCCQVPLCPQLLSSHSHVGQRATSYTHWCLSAPHRPLPASPLTSRWSVFWVPASVPTDLSLPIMAKQCGIIYISPNISCEYNTNMWRPPLPQALTSFSNGPPLSFKLWKRCQLCPPGPYTRLGPSIMSCGSLSHNMEIVSSWAAHPVPCPLLPEARGLRLCLFKPVSLALSAVPCWK